MTTTQNLHLPQWEADDRIMHDDFNNAFAALDTACGGMPKIAYGTYTGDGQYSQKINLDFTPKMVYVCKADGRSYVSSSNYYYYYGGLALLNHPCEGDSSTRPIVTITTNGFYVYYKYDTLNTTHYERHANDSGTTYYYVAIG